ncbi:MAG: exodeoxyribonuclease V subunit beta [Alcaligenaceae bacterium]|nr:exodeoxyribonuclease V subunit beta [Alcaligenaceae bacterium]
MTARNEAAMVPLDALSFPLWGSQLIEASAGTGKTYTIASLYVRLVLGHGALPGQRPLTPPDILVVTFTRAATQELRDRIRKRLNEAAACFLGDSEGDEFLCGLRDEYEPAHWPGCARQLRIAAEWMDDAAVSTIDAWCYRMLREHAFDSASLFDVEMDVNGGERAAEATADYWRLYIAPLAPDDLGRVLQAIAAQMSDKRNAANCDALADILHRRWLAQAPSYADDTPAPADILAALKQRSAACKAPWRQWVPELRELLQAAYDDNLFHKNRLRVNSWQGWLDKLQEWADDPHSRLPFDTSVAAWWRLTPGGLAEVWKDGTPPEHPGFQAMESLLQEIEALDADLARIFPHAARWVAQRVAELRRQRAMLDFNGLLEQLDGALRGPNGVRLADLIRQQFPAALIDEFQDTNPIQYRIFDCIYNIDTNREDALLALIGDPKQAIYRFRGADIHAYLAARRACAGRIHTLGSNYRSSAAMVGAVNHLFRAAEQARRKGAFLFRQGGADASAPEDNPVPFLPVEAAADPGEWWVDGQQAGALSIWCDTRYDKRGACAEAVAAACASEILRLLQLGAQERAGFRKNGEFRALQSSDIAILVNNRTEAGRLRDELGSRGIRSVYLSDDSSVYHSEAAADVLAWLRACAEPENGGYVRAALATAALGKNWSELDAFVRDEVRWEAMLERFAGYKEQWRKRGVLPMLRSYMHDFGVPARLFAQQDAGGQEGERQLTDLLHLAELLQAASTSHDGEHALIRHLEECIEEGGQASVDGDASRLRLESDAGLVQIVTVHKSKGLEYPLVFYPYAYHCRPEIALELPAAWHDETGGQRVLANLEDATDAQRQKILASREHERLAEDMRKLYVALTRARHATWVALAPVDLLGSSAMGYLLGGSDACSADTLQDSLAGLVGDSSDISVADFPQTLEGRYQHGDPTAFDPVWRSMSRRVEQRWSLSSYSSLSRLAVERFEHAAALHPDIANLALPDEARLETFLEGWLAEAAVQEATDLQAEWQPDADAVAQATGMHAFPKGATAGSLLHDLLEWVFKKGVRQALADHTALRAEVERRCHSRGWQAHTDVVADWLQGFFTHSFQLALPGGQAAGDLVLADLAVALPEMEFWFGVRDADLPLLDAVVTRHFVAGRPRAVIAAGRLNGMLRGFVDLVFEHEGRYYVADYKSNWLGATRLAYDGQAIADAILEHRYDLQSAIYLFALHRLLKSRLGDRYDYEQHVGGALVFFVRGIHSPSQGLHIERPPLAVIEQMESLFSGMQEGVPPCN